jgi:hypothetical protein
MSDQYDALARLIMRIGPGKIPAWARPFTGLTNDVGDGTLPPMEMPQTRLARLYGPLHAGIGNQGYGGPEPAAGYIPPSPSPPPIGYEMQGMPPLAARVPPQVAPTPAPLAPPPMPSASMDTVPPIGFEMQGMAPPLDRYAEAERRLRPEWLTNQGNFSNQQKWWD